MSTPIESTKLSASVACSPELTGGPLGGDDAVCDGIGLGEFNDVGDAIGVGEAGEGEAGVAVGRELEPALGLALGDACVPVGVGAALAGDDGELGEALA